METEKTVSNEAESPGYADELPADEYASPAALLREVADQVDGLSKRIEHLDVTAHEIDQKVTALTETLERYRPMLERFADPGGAARAFFAGHKTKGTRP